jgi:hypothetical protein
MEDTEYEKHVNKIVKFLKESGYHIEDIYSRYTKNFNKYNRLKIDIIIMTDEEKKEGRRAAWS